MVRGSAAHFLIGGGSEPEEAAEDTVAREAIEECGRPIAVGRKIGDAIQYFDADGTAFEMHATLSEARFAGEAGEATAAGEHALLWLKQEDAAAVMFHECHVWAIEMSAPPAQG